MVTFVIVSDFHYALDKYLDERTRSGRKLMQYAQPLLERLIHEVNETIRPDFVVNLGDLIQDYGDYDEDVATLKDFWVKFRGFEVPVFTCVGNHDLRTTKDRAAVAAALEYERTTYSVDVAGIHLVVLGTDVDYNAVDERGTKYEKHWISQSDLDWLAEDLAETELPVIVCLHFGVAEDLQEGNYWFGSCPEEGLIANRKELKAVLKGSGKVRAVFSGHQHWTKTLVEDGIPYYLVGSMTENYNWDDVPDGVYLVVSINEATVKVTTKYLRL
ncbi:MAG: metallophosphoesterase [Firmicutes bacterium]|nr:metallophosphoesterase [Bacillota bacterium]